MDKKELLEKEDAFDIIAEKVINAKVDSERFARFCNDLLEIIDRVEGER